jgi:hypothetical protein
MVSWARGIGQKLAGFGDGFLKSAFFVKGICVIENLAEISVDDAVVCHGRRIRYQRRCVLGRGWLREHDYMWR